MENLIGHHRRRARGRTAALYLLALALLILGGVYYAHRLTKWLAYDDEGGYLYAAWRITEGELPYRDFLTPQLPVFLYPGALVLKLSGLSSLAARAWSLLLTLASAALLLLLVRRLWGWLPALLALVFYLVQSETFWAARFFRPEAPMLFWGLLGLYLFLRGLQEERAGWLVGAGICLGLSMMAKLFGALYMAGVGFFLLLEGARTRDGRTMLRHGLQVGLPFLAVVLGIGGLFSLLSHNFVAAVLEHHLRQGSGTPASQVVLKALRLYWDFVREQPAFIVLALGGLIVALREGRQRGWLLVLQIPTALAFLLMTRGLQARHLTYLVPILAALAGVGLAAIHDLLTRLPSRRVRQGIAAVAIVSLSLLALWPHLEQNRWVASWEEHDTLAWAAYLQQVTAPDAFIMSDYPGLNFYARRRTTRIAAGISRGAATSGQILGADLIREIEAHDVQMVLLNVAQGAHQFVRLWDYEAFKHYVQTHFALVERRKYDYRLLEIYMRRDLWEGERLDINMGHLLKLSGQRWVQPQAAPGEQLQVLLRWQSLAPIPQDLRVTLTLTDEAGHVWGLGGKPLVDVDRETYWDERGLERAVLIPTSQWPPGEATLDAFELPVPWGTPPGEYLVMLRAHPKGLWAGLSVMDAAGAPAGQDVPLGHVTVLPRTAGVDAAQLPIETRLDRDVATGLRLLGHSMPREARPGDRLTLSLYWMATAANMPDYDLTLALGDEAHDKGSAPTQPLVGGLPTSRWAVGQVLWGQYDLTVTPETSAGEYPLMLRLWSGGKPVYDLVLAHVRVQGRQRLYEAPDVQHRTSASFGEQIELVGYDLPQTVVRPGGVLAFTLYWRARARMDASYKVFTHLLDGTSKLWGQQDNVPCVGECPTSSWLPGEYIVDAYSIEVAANAPPGPYVIEVGWYDGQTGVRLTALDAEGHPLEFDRFLITGVSVAGE